MSEDYRDALDAAHRRIERLERELSMARAGISHPAKSFAWVFAVVPLVLIGSVALLAYALHSPPPPPPPMPTLPLGTAAPQPASRYYSATFYTAGDTKPHLLDVDGDGKPEIVGLFWSANDPRPLRVGALDAETHTVRWMSEGMTSQWGGVHTHLTRIGGHVVVHDSNAKAHVFELAYGAEERVVSLPSGVIRACPARGSTTTLLQQTQDGATFSLDVLSGALTPSAERMPECSSPPPCTPTTPRETACLAYDEAAARKAKTPGLVVWGTARVQGDMRLYPGSIAVKKGEPDRDGLLLLDRAGTVRTWDGPAVAEGDTIHPGGSARSLVTSRGAVSVYPARNGELYVVVRNAEGKVLVHHAVQGAKEGSYVGEVYAEGDELFVFVDHALHRVSLETGAERPPIMWL